MAASTAWEVNGGAYAMRLDGIDDGLIAGTASQLPISRVYAFGCWARLDNAAGTNRLAIVWDTVSGVNQRTFQLNVDANTFQGDWQATSGNAVTPTFISSAKTIASNRWYHFWMQYNAVTQTREIYLDGNLEASTSQASIWQGATTTRFTWFYLGARVGDPAVAYGAGYADDIRIYDRALHPEEIRLLARYRGIAYTPARRVLYGGEGVAAVTARPWLYRRSTRMIGA